MVACHEHWSPLDLRQSIQFSCNTYYCRVFRSIVDKKTFISTRQGYENWRKHVFSFGFGKKLGIDIPGELNGNIPSPAYYDRYHGKNRWRSMTIISLAIGQGEIGITPIQMANLAALISNRGYYYIPHIIRAIDNPGNLNREFLQRKYTDIDPKYFDIVIEAMHAVIEGGTASHIRLDSIAICGKTGTAQNPHGKNHSVFIAFAPMENPKIAISVVVENAGFGATWAAPIASLMIEKYLKREVKRKEMEQNMINGNLMTRLTIADQ
jgi:penicillin-binding protein 2